MTTKEKILMIIETNPYMGKNLSVPMFRIFKIIVAALTRWHYKHSILPLVEENLNNSKFDVTVVAMDHYANQLLEKDGIPHRKKVDYLFASLDKESEESAMVWVRKVPKSIANEDFSNVLSYDSANLWYLLELSFWYLFKDIVKDVELVKHIIRTEKCDHIFIPRNSLIGNSFTHFYDGRITYFETNRLYGALNRFIISIMRNVLFLFTYIRTLGLWVPGRKPDLKKSLKPKLILFANEERIGNMSISWLEELKESMDRVAIGIEKDWGTMYKDNSIQYRTFREYGSKTIGKNVNKKRRELAKTWSSLIKDSKFKELWVYDGVNIWISLEWGFTYYFLYKFIEVIRYGELVKEIVRTEKPDVIVTIDDRSPFGKTVNVISNSLGVPTLIVQHGIVHDQAIEGEICSDKYAVFGYAFKDILIKRGGDPDKIVVTGQPRFDILVNKKYDKKLIYEKLNINREKGIVFFASTDLSDTEKEMTVRGLFEAMKDFPDKQLVIKPHPSDDGEMFEDMIRELDPNAIIVYSDLYELLHACDVLLTTWSTVGLEAILIDKPVIVINLMDIAAASTYVEKGAALEAKNAKDIKRTLKMVLYDPKTIEEMKINRKKYVMDYTYKSDGKASERVAQLIQKMIEEKMIL
jgi:hypothetical protein